MITLIVPTRNRAHTLRRVAPSYFQQEGVTEIIFVNDGGTDDTPKCVERLAQTYPRVTTILLQNDRRVGASESRNIGVRSASNDYILFCDDDESLEPGYAATCLAKLGQHDAGAVSGRRIYLEPEETQDQALVRFGNGMRNSPPFRPMICEYVNAAKFDGDLRLPITNAVILTRKDLLQRYPFDAHYARGNGYREESDFQMSLFTRGHDIVVTNACHSFHLPLAQVRTGGQRSSKVARLWWSIHYTNYFFAKYFTGYSQRMGIKAPKWLALTLFALFAAYRETVRPPLFTFGKWLVKRRRYALMRAA